MARSTKTAASRQPAARGRSAAASAKPGPTRKGGAGSSGTRNGRTRASASRAPRPAHETRQILDLLATQHPNAFTELDFRTPFELLVATVLSAQSTDKRVNEVTPALFARYPDAHALAAASTAELEPQLKATGFFRMKAKAIQGLAQTLVAQYAGEVPPDMAALTALPGVGRKTANVVLGHALGVPGFPVDRHVLRVANRLGIAQAATPEQVETQLCAALPADRWTVASDTLILHGRRICRPRPLCDRCAAVALCPFAARMGTSTSPPAKALAGPPAPRTARRR